MGSPGGRLFDLQYTVSNLGLSIGGTFQQSKTIKQDSKVPFYDKARIMEKGIPVTITPTKVALAFKSNGETIFTKNPIDIVNPGGNEVQGAFEDTIDEFIKFYFKQSFLKASGIYDYISKPTVFKKDLAAGARLGKSKGFQTGFKWIANVKIGVE